MKSYQNQVRKLSICAIFAALMVICTWIQIPGPVPFTLQTLAVCVTAALLGPAKSLSVIAVYIALGVLGLPVFSGFSAGPGALFGATGGYIFGFIGAALLISLIVRIMGDHWSILALSMVLGLSFCYLIGILWFMAVYAAQGEAHSLASALAICVTPFILPDLIKIGASVIIVRRLAPVMHKLGLQ